MLCLQCKAIDPHNADSTSASLKDARWFDQYPDFPALKASALNGCEFCGQLRHAMLHKYSDTEIAKFEHNFDDSVQSTWSSTKWNGDVEIYSGRFVGKVNSTYRDHAQKQTFDDSLLPDMQLLYFTFRPYPPRQLNQGIPSYHNWQICFDLYTEPYPTSFGPVRRRLPSAETLSSTNVKAIVAWLDVCSKKHTGCHQETPGPLPTRVIDVGPADGSQHPKLYVAAGQPSPYVALSHCWGKPTKTQIPRVARTLSGNLKDMVSAIPLESLPQNFQDAIVTVRVLGLRYLWIDALCIVQDSREDWEMEAARMGEYYRSAYLTLAATSAKASIDGFLARSPWPWPTISMPCPDQGSSTSHGKIHFRYQPEPSEYSRIDAIDKSVWNTRAWTYQERLLSIRILHFASDRLFWECRTMEGSEENEPPRESAYHTPWMATKAEARHSLVYPDEAGFDNRYERWYRLVSRYSQRELSYESDVFPALSGLADAFHKVYTDQDRYIAGLWQADIFRGLLWMTKDSSEATRPSVDRAPSWSWASVKGEVEWPSRTTARHCHYNYAVQLLEAQTDTGPGGALGAVTGGMIKLLGKYQRLDKVLRPPIWEAVVRFRFDLVSADEVIGSGAFDIDSEIQADAIWILQIEVQGPGDSSFPYHPSGLLLKQVDGAELRFSRVGYCALDEEYIGFFDKLEPNELCLV
ncbi:MAG: hypothetical protein LQ341_005090 [Variospora aurantia]|nr:MAG: hypothetical protein LQ341_005090 [Variospora aurantia]